MYPSMTHETPKDQTDSVYVCSAVYYIFTPVLVVEVEVYLELVEVHMVQRSVFVVL